MSIQNCPIFLKCLIDTGAEINLIHQKCVPKETFIYNTAIKVKAANDQPMIVKGMMITDISINDTKFSKVKFYIADLYDYDAILGSEFIQRNIKRINLENNNLYLEKK